MELGYLTGINQARLSHIERGFRKPSGEEQAKLAEALGLTAEKIEYPREPSIGQSRIRVR
jgi:transcriptional regulator with XRE-family HTH domain